MGETAKTMGRDYSRKEVVEIIRSVLGTVIKDQAPTTKLHRELAAIADYIDNMRTELAQLRSAEINEGHIPTASDELNAVVEETASATGRIMDSCDRIQQVADKLDGPNKDTLANNITAIYEACSFQDITGQRITKVVKTLQHIEQKVDDIIKAFGNTLEDTGPIDVSVQEAGKLENGPQLKGKASSQEDIDAILASFDK